MAATPSGVGDLETGSRDPILTDYTQSILSHKTCTF